MSTKPVNLVYFYSKEDRVVSDVVSDLLRMQKANLISIWSSAKITGGKDVDAEISNKLEAAQIVLLFVSRNFDSEDCFEIISGAIEKSQNNQLRLVPILIDTFVTIEDKPYYNLIINHDAPLDVESRHKRKEACDYVSKIVMRIAKEISGNVSVQFNSATEQNQKARTLNRKKEIPSFYFLTQFCNRDEQTDQIRTALNEQQNKMQKHGGKAVPLFCIIHGDIVENVEGYKQRLVSRDITQLTKTGQESVRMVNIKFPTRSNETGKTFAYFQKTLSAEVFEGDTNASLLDIFRRLGGHSSPVMICFGLQTESWNEETQKAVRVLVEFFNSVPSEARSHTPIIVCLFFTYDEELNDDEQSKKVNKSYWTRLSERIFSYNKESIETQSRKKQVQGFFSELSGEFKGEIYKNLCGVVLTKLPSVRKYDVEIFLDTSKIFTFCRNHKPYYCHPDGIVKVKSNVADLYKTKAVLQKIDNKNVRTIPMKTLNDELSKYLEQYCCLTINK